MKRVSLFDEKYIVRHRRSVAKLLAECHIYFLLQGDEIVYVGQADNVGVRLRAHQKDKQFDSYYDIQCEKEEANSLEHYFILKFSPKYNREPGGRHAGYYSLDQIKRKLGIGRVHLKHMISEHEIASFYWGGTCYYKLEDFRSKIPQDPGTRVSEIPTL